MRRIVQVYLNGDSLRATALARNDIESQPVYLNGDSLRATAHCTAYTDQLSVYLNGDSLRATAQIPKPAPASVRKYWAIANPSTLKLSNYRVYAKTGTVTLEYVLAHGRPT